MDLTTSMRVEAVGNACCAFSKERVDACWASTDPAASTRGCSSPPPDARRFDPPAPFVQAAESNGAKMEIPEAVVDRLEADVFPDQDGTHGHGARVPRHRAAGADAPNFKVARILEQRQPVGQAAGRGRVHPA